MLNIFHLTQLREASNLSSLFYVYMEQGYFKITITISSMLISYKFPLIFNYKWNTNQTLFVKSSTSYKNNAPNTKSLLFYLLQIHKLKQYGKMQLANVITISFGIWYTIILNFYYFVGCRNGRKPKRNWRITADL